MSILAPRLKALAKRVTLLERESDPTVQAVLLRLEACLDDIEKILPARQRGRPKQREIVPFLLCFIVDGLKKRPGSGITTDKEALHYFLRSQRGNGQINTMKTLQNQLARARKSWR